MTEGAHATAPAPPCDEAWEIALRLAWDGFCVGTTPVGAVVVGPSGDIVTAGRGRRYESSAPQQQLANSHVAHGELNALAQLPVDRHWEDHVLLTTLEPCGMCHGAAVQATIGGLAYAAPDPYGGTAGTPFTTPQSRRRPLALQGPLPDERGAFATLLHIVWLMERPTAGHVVALHHQALPALTAYAEQRKSELLRAAAAGDYLGARGLGAEAPCTDLVAAGG